MNCLVTTTVGIILLTSAGGIAEDNLGYGPWRLGMSKTEVRGIAEFAPYKDVAFTGGLETQNGVFEGRKTNVSFVFGERGLQKIQIWAYEGESLDAAIDSWYRVRQYLSQRHGVVEMRGLKVAADTNREDFAVAVRTTLEGLP